MSKTITIAFAVCLIAVSTMAQTTPSRPDTILLSVYNNGYLFKVTPAAFGPRTPATDLLAEMVAAYDTLMSFETVAAPPPPPPPPNAPKEVLEKMKQAFASLPSA